MKGVMLIVPLFLLIAVAPCFAQDGNVPQATLNSLGLGGMELMSDAEGLQIRGQASASVQTRGSALIVGQLLTFDNFNNAQFVFGSAASSAEDNAMSMDASPTTISASHDITAQFNTPLSLTVIVPFFSGTIDGSVRSQGTAIASY